MSTETLALAIIWAAAPPATLVPVLYAIAARWYRTLEGRALMASTLALALLIDLALLFRAWDGHPVFKQRAAIAVYALICVGAWLMFLFVARSAWSALRSRIHEQLPRRPSLGGRASRPRRLL